MLNFAQIIYNVGIRVGDTSTAFSGILSGYVNQRYQRIFKKFNWSTVVPGYTFNTVAGTQDYGLPTDFKNELYVYDSTNLLDIKRVDFQELERINTSALNQQGNVTSYTIYDSMDSNSPANIIKKIRLYQIPNSVLTLSMPYIKQGVNLVSSTDLPIIDMSDLASELGATADAWRTKRQFQKASDFDAQYEQVIQEMIWSIENNPNRVVQFRPNVYCRDQLYGGDGTSYYQGY